MNDEGVRLSATLDLIVRDHMAGRGIQAVTRAAAAVKLIDHQPELARTASGATLVGYLGVLEVFAARLGRGAAAIERCLTAAREAGLKEVLGLALSWRAALLVARGELEAAIADGCRSLELAERVDSAYSVASATLCLCRAYLLNHSWGEALEVCKISLERVRSSDAGPALEPHMLVHLGEAQLGLGETAAARASIDRGLTLAHDRNLPLTVGRGRIVRATWMLHTQGAVARQEIQNDLDGAEVIAKESGTLLWLPPIDRLRAHTFAAYGDLTSARHQMERAIKAYYGMGATRSGERLTDELMEMKW